MSGAARPAGPPPAFFRPIPPRRRALALARAVWNAALTDRVSLTAAGCAFYALLALFPALSVVINVYGLFFDLGSVEPQLRQLRMWLPGDAYEIVRERVHLLVTTPATTLGVSASVSLLVALWFAGSGVRGMIGALNMANGTVERRSFLAFHLASLAVTAGTLMLVVLGIGLLAAWPRVVDWVGVNEGEAIVVRLGGLAILASLTGAALCLLYRYGPCRPPVGPLRVWPGAVAATLLWGAALLAFGYYLTNIATYGATYGSLGAAVAMLMWMFVSVYVIILGAELNAALGRTATAPRTGRDR